LTVKDWAAATQGVRSTTSAAILKIWVTCPFLRMNLKKNRGKNAQ
jgi:hypothetical protein